MRPDNLLELFEIDPAATGLPRDGRPEPDFGSRPLLVEFDDADLKAAPPVDPERAAAAAPAGANDRQPPLLSTPLRGQTLASWAMAVGVYLVTLLLLFPWDLASAPPAPPIPVQLVIEQPPPPPPQPAPAPAPPLPKVEEKPPIGPIASVDMGQTAGKPDVPDAKPTPPPEPQTAAVEPPKPKPPSPSERQAKTVEPPKPPPPSILTSALPKPTLPDAAAELPEPEPPPMLDLTPPPARKPPKQPVYARAPPDRPPAPHPTEYPGPAATRNEYLAYCEAMIRRYRTMVSDSFIAGRRGSTTLTLLVLGDGTVARVSVVQSSGYEDIDNRIEQMVAAVRRFPPLPQWYQGPSMRLMYHFAFPDRR